MNELQYIEETALALCDRFEMENPAHIASGDDRQRYEFLKSMLSKRLKEMIDHEFDKFVNLLYRLDVSEAKVKEALAVQPFSEAVGRIAEMIIQRQMQKVITRKQYASPKHDIEFDI